MDTATTTTPYPSEPTPIPCPPHWWIVSDPVAGLAAAHCKKCGSERAFSVKQPDWLAVKAGIG